MQTVQVIYSRSRLPLSYVIRAFDKGTSEICPFSHLGIISECGCYVYEARMFEGVIKTPLWLFKHRASKWETGVFPVLHRATAYRLIKEEIGKDYDWGGVLGLAIPFIGRDWECPDSWFCSELLAHASQIFDRKHASRIGVAFCYAMTRSRPL